MTFFRTIGLLLLVLATVNLWWRWLSRRHSLPCPTWFSWGLESSLMDRILGTQATLDRIGLQPGQWVLEKPTTTLYLDDRCKVYGG